MLVLAHAQGPKKKKSKKNGPSAGTLYKCALIACEMEARLGTIPFPFSRSGWAYDG